MPSRNTLKDYLSEATYHVYNRGVERRQIFMDHHDYQRFKQQMRQCLDRELQITLLAFSLMPNHFHLLLSQSDDGAMSRFMKRLSTAYAMYFNKKYHRVGSLFQGKYKAARIVGAQHLMEISRYIHLNPERAGLGWRQHQHSSVASYVKPGVGVPSLADPTPVLALFDVPGDYRRYLSKGKVRP